MSLKRSGARIRATLPSPGGAEAPSVQCVVIVKRFNRGERWPTSFRTGYI